MLVLQNIILSLVLFLCIYFVGIQKEYKPILIENGEVVDFPEPDQPLPAIRPRTKYELKIL